MSRTDYQMISTRVHGLPSQGCQWERGVWPSLTLPAGLWVPVRTSLIILNTGVMHDWANNRRLSAHGYLVVPNTVLRSRLVGKHLLPAFPSVLPQNTILDCILDQNWTQNGILHILDVIKWKGQDIGDCETLFRWETRFTCEGNKQFIYTRPL